MLIISPTNPTNESLAAESPLTVLAACRQIARKYVIPESEVKYEIANALLAGHLYVRNQAGFPSCPDVFDLSVECITLNDLNAYFESNGYRYRLCRTDFAESNAGDEEVGASPRRLPVSEVRIREILSYLTENGINPMCIPWGMKPKVKKHFTEELKLCTSDRFDYAWKVGRGKRFRVENHDDYARRY